MGYGNRGHRYGAGATTATTDAEFVGRVGYVGSEPAFLSGTVPAFQPVGLKVTDVRRGAVSVGDNVDLDVLVAAGQPHVGIGESGLPALDASMVRPGVLLVAWANAVDGRWRAIEVSTDGPSSADNYAGRRPAVRR